MPFLTLSLPALRKCAGRSSLFFLTRRPMNTFGERVYLVFAGEKERGISFENNMCRGSQIPESERKYEKCKSSSAYMELAGHATVRGRCGEKKIAKSYLTEFHSDVF